MVTLLYLFGRKLCSDFGFKIIWECSVFTDSFIYSDDQRWLISKVVKMHINCVGGSLRRNTGRTCKLRTERPRPELRTLLWGHCAAHELRISDILFVDSTHTQINIANTSRSKIFKQKKILKKREIGSASEACASVDVPRQNDFKKIF